EPPENRASALRTRASSYQQQGDLDHAIADYTTALKTVVNNPEQPRILAKIHLNRGLMYFRKNDYAKALADYNEAIALDPKLALAYVNRAAILANRRDDDRAIADLDKAASISP